MLVLMALLPVVHLLSISSLDALSRLPFLKVRSRFIGSVVAGCGRSSFSDRWKFSFAKLPQMVSLIAPASDRLASYLVTRRSSPPLPLVCCTLQQKLTERDRIAVMFCGSHKTLAFGIPLIKV